MIVAKVVKGKDCIPCKVNLEPEGFSVSINGNEGVCDKEGKCIIQC